MSVIFYAAMTIISWIIVFCISFKKDKQPEKKVGINWRPIEEFKSVAKFDTLYLFIYESGYSSVIIIDKDMEFESILKPLKYCGKPINYCEIN